MKPIFLCITSLSFLFISCSQINHDKADLFNQTASLSSRDTIPVNPFAWKVITSMINKKDKTMATLYGNDAAFNDANQQSGDNYPAGAELALVTWYQKPDKHWFGANIPGTIKSIEFLKFATSSTDLPKPVYRRYEGVPLKLSKTDDAEIVVKRTTFIINQKKSVIPR